MENKRCMERRFISFDKVEYIMIYMCIVVSIDNMNVQQENKRLKFPPRANPTQKPLENHQPSYQKGRNALENYVYTDFGHDKIIFLKSFLDENSHNTPYLQHCTDKKIMGIFFYLRNSPVEPLFGASWRL